MLSLVREALVSSGFVTSQARLVFNVMVSRGEAIALDVWDPGTDAWYHVQACFHYDLSERFASYRLAHDRFRERTPRPLAHLRLDGWSLLVATACEHRIVRARDLDSARRSAHLLGQLIGFFATARASSLDAADACSHDLFMAEAGAFLADSRDAGSALRRYLGHVDRTLWADIPHIPQHGDFVLNNLGAARGDLLVFDWEDYGATALAGFDIFMISLSVAGMSATSARLIRDTEDPAASPWFFAQRACAASALPYASFRRAVPLYLIVFRYLKRNYGREIGQRIDAILEQVLP